MSKKIDQKILLEEIKRGIGEFYPYFLGFYFLSLIIAAFSKTWRGFFYWPAFNAIAVVYSLLFVLTVKFNFSLFRDGRIIGEAKKYLRRIGVRFWQYFIFVRSRLLRLRARTWLKILLMAAIMILAAIHGVGVIDLLVLLYALASVLFVLDSRWSAAVALVLLASCPVLLILKKDPWAENGAVYAYYFLVITVLTQIREFRQKRGKRPPVDNSLGSVVADEKT
jgi:hypothetical protein